MSTLQKVKLTPSKSFFGDLFKIWQLEEAHGDISPQADSDNVTPGPLRTLTLSRNFVERRDVDARDLVVQGVIPGKDELAVGDVQVKEDFSGRDQNLGRVAAGYRDRLGGRRFPFTGNKRNI